jgi:hypothetical protein
MATARAGRMLRPVRNPSRRPTIRSVPVMGSDWITPCVQAKHSRTPGGGVCGAVAEWGVPSWQVQLIVPERQPPPGGAPAR